MKIAALINSKRPFIYLSNQFFKNGIILAENLHKKMTAFINILQAKKTIEDFSMWHFYLVQTLTISKRSSVNFNQENDTSDKTILRLKQLLLGLGQTLVVLRQTLPLLNQTLRKFYKTLAGFGQTLAGIYQTLAESKRTLKTPCGFLTEAFKNRKSGLYNKHFTNLS